MRRAGKIAFGILAALLVVILAAFGSIQTSFGKRQILAQLESQLSASPARLRAQAIEGFVPFDFTLVGASLSDQDGPWLQADRLHLKWSPSALLRKTLSVNALDADRLAVLRAPIVLSPTPTPPESDNAFTLPSLPVDIVVNRLAIDRLDLGPSFLGEAASFNLQARAKLGDPANGLQASLRLNRTDRDSDRVSLGLDYRPAADSLNVSAAASEPTGGLITKSLGLSGAPKLALALQGRGPLVDWHATGHAELDDRPLLTLSASSNGPTTDRKIAFDLHLAELPMLSSNLNGIIEGGVAAQGTIHLAGTSGPVTIESLKLHTRPGTITASGAVNPNTGKLDLDLATTLNDSTPFAALLPPELHWDGVDAKLHLAGTFTDPQVTLNGAITGLAYAANQIGQATIDADTALRIDTMQASNTKLSVSAQSITLADPKLQPLLADGATLNFAGSLDNSGAITADQLDLHVGTVGLNTKGTAEAWGMQAAHVTGNLSADDLASLSELVGLNAKGKAGIDLTLDKQGDALAAQVNASTEGFALGIPPVNRLLGPAPTLAAAVRRDAEGAITIDTAVLQAAAAKLTVSGSMAADRTLALKADGALSDLSRMVPNVSGGVQFTAAISGSADDPAIKMQVSSASLRADQVAVSALQSSIDATGLLSTPRAAVKLTASVNGEPASVAVDARADSSFKRATLSGIAVRLGSTAITGKLDLALPTASGDLTLSSPDLGVLAPFIGQKATGAVNGTIALSNLGGRQNVALKLNGKAIGIPDVSVATLALTANATDVLRDDPALDAALTASKVEANDQLLDRVDLKASGHRANLALTANASGPRGSIATNALIQNHGSDTEIGLAKLDLAFGTVKANLLHPAQIAFHGSETKISGFALASRGGSATLDADLSADANAVTLQLSRLPASVLEAAAPDLHILGTLDGKLALSGPKSAPNATFDLRGTSFGVQGASQQLANVKLDGTWQGGQLAATGRVDLTKTSGLDLKLRLPMVAAPATGFPVFDTNATLDAAAVGKIDLGLLNAFIPGGADHVAGLASLDLSAKGALARPVLAGKVDISDGAYENQRYGTRFQNLTAEIDGNGSKLSIVSLSGTTPGGGTMSGKGDIDFGGAMPVGINVTLNNARMIDAPIGTAIVGGSLRMKGTLTEHVDLVGTVGIVRAEITIPDRFPPNIEEIPTVDVNGSPAHAAQSATAADADQPPPKSLQIGLDIAVKAPGQVFVRGRGLDAEVGGDLHIQGTADQPFILGALKLRQGDFNLLSRDLQFQTGTITFSGGKEIDPLLDFTATTKITAADVTVTVGGTATHPSIAVQSSPELPQDELLAQLLFGKASGSLSPFEAIQLAQATAELSGVSAGSGTLDKLRKTLGLDRLDVGSDTSSGGPTLSAGRYVSRRVYVGAKQGTKPGSSVATVEIELTPNVKLNTDVGADSSGKAGVTMEWNY